MLSTFALYGCTKKPFSIHKTMGIIKRNNWIMFFKITNYKNLKSS